MTTTSPPAALPTATPLRTLVEAESSPGSDDAPTLLNERRARRLQVFGTCSSLGAAAIGAVALTGWIFGIDLLKSVVPGLVTMKANTALAFVVVGLSLFAVQRSPLSRLGGLSAACGALFTLLLSAAVTSQYIHGHDLGVDLLLFYEPPETTGTVYPGRMAVNTGACFIAVSVGVLLTRWRAASAAPAFGLLVVTAGALALTGYVTGITSLYGLEGVTQMAIPTATGFVLLGSALVCGQPNRGPMQLLTSDGAGGSLVRRLLPATVGGVLFVVTLRLLGQEVGLYGTQVGVWLTASGVLALMVPIIWRVAWSVERTDAQRRAALKELRELAERDPLTRLFNRRRFEEEMGRHLALAKRHHRPFAVLTLDLDGFKTVNDTLGHQAGDEVLCGVARVLESELRGSDAVARFGGDEFVALLSETRIDGARAVASKLCDAICSRAQVRASIGGVVCEDTLPAGLTAMRLLRLADAELYRAKNDGGDASHVRTLRPGEAMADVAV